MIKNLVNDPIFLAGKLKPEKRTIYLSHKIYSIC